MISLLSSWPFAVCLTTLSTTRKGESRKNYNHAGYFIYVQRSRRLVLAQPNVWTPNTNELSSISYCLLASPRKHRLANEVSIVSRSLCGQANEVSVILRSLCASITSYTVGFGPTKRLNSKHQWHCPLSAIVPSQNWLANEVQWSYARFVPARVAINSGQFTALFSSTRYCLANHVFIHSFKHSPYAALNKNKHNNIV